MAEQLVVVVGAGIVGVCIAHELRKRGLGVLLIDRMAPGNGCSYGNSGAVSESSVAPLAMPGLLRSVPRMLLDPDGPLYLPLGYMPRAIPWLSRFALCSSRRVMHASSDALTRLHADAIALHERLTREIGAPELLLKRGHLYLYPDETTLASDALGWRLREQHGFRPLRLDRKGILELEPHAPASYPIGLFLEDQATIVNPWRYVDAIQRHFLALGGRFRQVEMAAALRTAQGWRLILKDAAQPIEAAYLVLATGAWTQRLLGPLGVRIPLESQRGYHLQFKGGIQLSRTLVLADKKIFISPMEEGLRLGGTVEIGGLDAPPNARRIAALRRIALTAFPALRDTPYTEWMGHRPCTPNSLPCIGPVHGQPCLWLAAGHGHLGLTDSAGTAQRIADDICGRSSGLQDSERRPSSVEQTSATAAQL